LEFDGFGDLVAAATPPGAATGSRGRTPRGIDSRNTHAGARDPPPRKGAGKNG
jgi:hypothetical protein